jgi:hypothetical protein
VSSFINFTATHSYNTVDSNFYMWIKRRMHLEKLREHKIGNKIQILNCLRSIETNSVIGIGST